MKSKIYILVAILFCSLNFLGCSLIGIGIGINSVDDKKYFPNHKEIRLIDSAKTINVIKKDGRKIKGEYKMMKELLIEDNNKSLPLNSAIVLSKKLNGGQTYDEVIPLSEIREIIVRQYNSNWVQWLIIGAVIDALIIYKVNYDLHHMNLLGD